MHEMTTTPLLDYEIASVEQVMTPALAIYLDAVEQNVSTTLRLLDGDPNRWRPHVKTSKLLVTMKLLVNAGVRNFKCATTLELITACEAGATDVLVAFPSVGARAQRVQEIGRQFPSIYISTLIENVQQIETWRGSRVSLFIDVNAGMNRTGMEQAKVAEIVELAVEISRTGCRFRGLHYYDGHHRNPVLSERVIAVHRGYDQLIRTVEAIQDRGISVDEVITSGTPAFPCSLSYHRFRDAAFTHRASPGTVVYNDLSSLSQLPAEWGYQPAALVVATVVSHPKVDLVTCDAGHKTVSADAGFPNCAVWNHPELTPLHASEEHLPIQVTPGSRAPDIGEILYLVPCHVCPTVNNFDDALLVRAGRIVDMVPVTARGRETPWLANERPWRLPTS
jgi:D-serine deaminase-like pyridoxal phosphate-dependent protein